jgi:hypothetical protein
MIWTGLRRRSDEMEANPDDEYGKASCAGRSFWSNENNNNGIAWVFQDNMMVLGGVMWRGRMCLSINRHW